MSGASEGQRRADAVAARSAEAHGDLPEADVASAVELLRDRRARLREAVSTRCEPEGCAPCPSLASCAGYEAIDEVLDAVARAEEQLGAALERAARHGSALAQLAGALRATAAHHAATLGAIGDGVIDVDVDGNVRLLTPPAATALGVREDDLLGRPLREVPALGALHAAIVTRRHEPVLVALLHGDVLVRAQAYDGGFVATLRELGGATASGARTVASAARYTFDDLVGADPELVRVLEDARRAAGSDVAILVCGESGTGKELLAQAIHNASPRAAEPFLGVNVTAIPRELLESELFGYEGGAFTGARPGGRPGKFELAGRGTLLLDELADMPLEMQSKLLRVLQEKRVGRLGGAREIPMRARVIATTGRDLAEAVRLGRFRLDLFHRLCVLPLHLPPLRERRDDVPLLVEHHLRDHAAADRRRVRVAPHVMAALRAHDWPGNVRQLLNVLDGELSVLPPGADELSRIPAAVLAPPRAHPPADPADGDVLPLDAAERRACDHALGVFAGNVARAAHALGIAKGTLYRKIRRYGLALQAEAASGAAEPGDGAGGPAPDAGEPAIGRGGTP